MPIPIGEYNHSYTLYMLKYRVGPEGEPRIFNSYPTEDALRSAYHHNKHYITECLDAVDVFMEVRRVVEHIHYLPTTP